MYPEVSKMKPSSSIPEFSSSEAGEIPMISPSRSNLQESEYPKPVGIQQQISQKDPIELPKDISETVEVFTDSTYRQNKYSLEKEIIPTHTEKNIPVMPLEL